MKKGDITNEIVHSDHQAIGRVQQDAAFQIGLMVMSARIKKGMTQTELAQKIGTKQPAIARIESGISLPSLSVLEKIARLGFDSYLLSPQFAFTQQAAPESVQYAVTSGMSGTMTERLLSPYALNLNSAVLKTAKNNTVNPNYISVIKE
ncbi:MAG: helix-turn-helix transcriptional regulator [Patescibacteria group bacterium]